MEAKAIVDFCLPHPAQCPKTINRIGKKYLQKEGKEKSHYFFLCKKQNSRKISSARFWIAKCKKRVVRIFSVEKT